MMMALRRIMSACTVEAFESQSTHMPRIEEIGEHNLEGCFVGMGARIDEVNARWVADSLDTHFSDLPNEAKFPARRESRRLATHRPEQKAMPAVPAHPIQRRGENR
jgi:hypothetical protein